VSVEPMLEPIDLMRCIEPNDADWDMLSAMETVDGDSEPEEFIPECQAECDWVNCDDDLVTNPEWLEWNARRPIAAKCIAFGQQIDWVICGGESGSNRRPFDKQWAVDLYNQCDAANVPFFFKQGSALKPGQDAELPSYGIVREWPK